MCYYNIIVSYVGEEQLRTSMKAISLPSSTVDRSTGEDNNIVFFVYMLIVTVVSYL